MDIEIRLLPELESVIITVVVLLILYLLLKKLLYKPVSRFMQKRSDLIQSEIDDAKEMKQEAKYIKDNQEKIINEAHIGTNPAPGVIATNPTTAPVAAPNIVGFPCSIFSISNQESNPIAAEVLVVIKACTASELAPRALPALKPNQPNHKSAAPKTTKGIL